MALGRQQIHDLWNGGHSGRHLQLDQPGNLGIGHGAADAGAGYTYLDEKTGHDFSAIAGFTYNLMNTSTNYQNGVDFHLDWGASQYLSKQGFIGAVGCIYNQVSPDSGTGDRVGASESRVIGVGPQIGYIFPVRDMLGFLGTKVYREFEDAHSPDGWNVWLTFAISPAASPMSAAGSAALSGLVVKGSFFIAVRLWFQVMPALPGRSAAQLLAALGAAAMLFGSIAVLRQERLKLLIAYSTLAQIGYLFLMFPLAYDAGTTQIGSAGALSGGMLQAISHATAKAAMFMAAGLIYGALGHDRLAGLVGLGRALPITLVAFAVAGVALIGVPPSGAYAAKTLLLQAADQTRNGGGRS